MATVEERQAILGEVQNKVKELAEIDPKALARTSDLSPDINFKEAVPHFEEMLEVCKQLRQRDLSRLTHNHLTSISGALDRLTGLITEVKSFTLNQNTPGDVCKNIITSVSSAYDEVMDPLLLPLAFTATQATDYARIEREAKGYYTTMKAEAEALSKFIASTRSEAERALAAVKEQAAEAGVSSNAHIFVTEAQRHEKLASAWLKATISTASLTLIAAIAALVTAFIYHPADLSAGVQYVVAKYPGPQFR